MNAVNELKSARAQLDLFSHSCFQVVADESYVTLAERLNPLAATRKA